MGIGSMLKMTLTPTPRWIEGVEVNGRPASATVLSDPKQVIEGIGGYGARTDGLTSRPTCSPKKESSSRRRQNAAFLRLSAE